jgi:hypothetical protein
VRWVLAVEGDPGSAVVVIPVAALSLVGGLGDAGYLRWRLPYPARQAPRYWLSVLGAERSAFAWGILIGSGWQTHWTYAVFHVPAFRGSLIVHWAGASTEGYRPAATRGAR